MTMEAPDQLERMFREKFAHFEAEAPADAWEKLQEKLFPPARSKKGRFSFAAKLTMPVNRYKIAGIAGIAGIFIILLFAALYFLIDTRYEVTGNAYAGADRLCRGTAILFRVDDRQRPWDSVSYYRSAVISDNGSYRFGSVQEGKYLLRIEPDPGTEHSGKFKPSWYEMHQNLEHSQLIYVYNDVGKADVHLVEREEAGKD